MIVLIFMARTSFRMAILRRVSHVIKETARSLRTADFPEKDEPRAAMDPGHEAIRNTQLTLVGAWREEGRVDLSPGRAPTTSDRCKR